MPAAVRDLVPAARSQVNPSPLERWLVPTRSPVRIVAAAWLALRSVFWTLALPGAVAFYAPWRYFGVSHASPDLSNPMHVAGLVVAAAGTAVLVGCIVEFARTGRGTLSPLDPPRQLVVRGLYRYVRNPMYLGVTAIVLGEALLAPSMPLVCYWLLWFGAANSFIIGYEEPALERQFGQSYVEYRRRVGRWIPRRPQPAL